MLNQFFLLCGAPHKRKNYLFFGSDVGGETAAVLYTFTQSCQGMGIEPWRYLRDVLDRMPSHLPERLAELLPDEWARSQRGAAEAVTSGSADEAIPPASG
jgi:transposase